MSPKSAPAQTPGSPLPSSTEDSWIFQSLLHPEVSLRTVQLSFQTQPMPVSIHEPQSFRYSWARKKTQSSSPDTALEFGFRRRNLIEFSKEKGCYHHTFPKLQQLISACARVCARICSCVRKRQRKGLKNIYNRNAPPISVFAGEHKEGDCKNRRLFQ